MDGGDITTVVTTFVSGVALLVSGCALTYSRRSARAAEDAVREARRSANATEANVDLGREGLEVSRRDFASSIDPEFDLVLGVAPGDYLNPDGITLEWTVTMRSGPPLVLVTANCSTLVISGPLDHPSQERVNQDVGARQMSPGASLFGKYSWRGGSLQAVQAYVTVTSIDQSPNPLLDSQGRPWAWTTSKAAGWSNVPGLKVQGMG